ncbi:hypothetical protein HYFRA_00000240 [Hymenoscyphus fraxineus]|uniref:Secreted protein n=1 Tax=Hymenoscyphus fraxineus TaxID=746836 RepID=A0A9N9L547_9HELO|nr:hypothetical protein HYFRA_00000240 [Hymenoscyphus fraxineus]
MLCHGICLLCLHWQTAVAASDCQTRQSKVKKKDERVDGEWSANKLPRVVACMVNLAFHYAYLQQQTRRRQPAAQAAQVKLKSPDIKESSKLVLFINRPSTSVQL